MGSIGWVAQVSRPDLSYAHINFACKAGRATVEDGRKIARIINKLAETKYDIRFSNLGNIEELKLVTFADASPSHNNIVETFIGSITFLENEEGKMNVVDWKTKKLDIPTVSALSAEGEAAVDSYGRLKFTKALFSEMIKKTDVQCKIVVDSASLKQAVDSDNSVKDKRTAVAVCTLRRCKESEGINVQWVKGTNQLADVLTKPNVNSLPLVSVLNGNKFDGDRHDVIEKDKKHKKYKRRDVEDSSW